MNDNKKEKGRPIKTVPDFLRVDPAVSGRQSRTGMRSTSITDLKNSLAGDHMTARSSSSGRSTPNAAGMKVEPTNGANIGVGSHATRSLQMHAPVTPPSRASPSGRQSARASKSEMLAQLAARSNLKTPELSDPSATNTNADSPR